MAAALPARIAQLRLRDLMLLEHLHELGTLTEAAARMHVTQSAITQALQSLEKAFGRPLVARGRRGQRRGALTPAGVAALAHLRVARHELEAALAATAASGSPELRLGALPLALVQTLPAALARLRGRLPQVHVRLTEDTVPSLWQRLEAGEFDAIVCRLPALGERQRFPEGVTHRTIGHDSLVLVCAREHPIARRRKPPLGLLREYDWVLPPEGSYTRLAVDQLFLRSGLNGPRPAVTSMSFHANLRLAAEGGLLAVAPRSAALAVRDALDLALIPLDWAREDTAVILVWREASRSNPALAAFLECFG
jgi:DNA-binding transcriptional LysR family regulator